MDNIQFKKYTTGTIYITKENEVDIGIKYFNSLKNFGKGTLGKVMLVEHKSNKQLFIIK